MVDDTAQRPAGQATLKSPSATEARYRTLFNEIDEGFCIIEFLDGPHGTLSDYIHIEANPAYARHTGIPNVVGQKLRTMVPAEAEGWLARYRPVLETGKPIRFEQTLEATGRRLELAAFRIEPPELRQVAVLFTDVTARWQAEQQLRQHAEELRQHDRLKNEFIAMLAHELRGPLAPIGNMLEVLKRTQDDPILVRQARETIERQHASLHRLVDDLLDLNRITRDTLVLRKQRVELRPIIEQAVETVKPIAAAAGHRIELSLPAEPIHLDADPVRLAQVFSNLLNNACKYMEPGGRIWITAARERLDAVVSVRDTGIGLPADKLETIFEMFTQVDKTLERARGGLGIGLTLVRRLVALHHGSVKAASDGLGQGSEFTVRLPVYEGAHADEAASARLGNEVSGRRILVVDDNPDTAESLALLLEMSGNATQTAHDALTALEKAASYRPDTVLMDLGLPGMSGFDACRTMREQPWGKELVIVAVSGWGQEEDRRKSREAGFDAHLVKPVDYATLRELLTKVSRPR